MGQERENVVGRIRKREWGERVEQVGRQCRERMSGARENGESGVIGAKEWSE